MRNKLVLKFTDAGELSLFESYFLSENPARSCHSVRGKVPGAYLGAGTFQWTSAVKALSVLAMRSKAAALQAEPAPFALEGFRSSLASSLDFALSKQTTWLVEMFGYDATEQPLLKRLFLRSNPNLKRPGPVGVALNPSRLTATDIEIVLQGATVNTASQLLALAEEIERGSERIGQSAYVGGAAAPLANQDRMVA